MESGNYNIRTEDSGIGLEEQIIAGIIRLRILNPEVVSSTSTTNVGSENIRANRGRVGADKGGSIQGSLECAEVSESTKATKISLCGCRTSSINSTSKCVGDRCDV